MGRRAFLSCLWVVALSMAAAVPAQAQDSSGETVVTSAAPDSVAVTIYRAPDRDADEAMELDWLRGYAFITEQRTIDIPAGDAMIRFEGVAGGILPESALISGLPTGVREKNLDADLISARNLFARFHGRPVILRRQRGRDGHGTLIEERAVIRSGADGAAILQTRDGFEVADCGRGIFDELVYPGLPAGLSARPTLSVRTTAPSAQHVTVTLSYLAWGFDWQTNYTIRLDPGTGKADLLAWVTLASSDPTSFPEATAAVVGGEVNREDEPDDGDDGEEGELVLRCYLKPLVYPSSVALPPPPPSPMAMYSDIVVTAQRRSESLMSAATVVQEEGLGDLKLYRVPVPTTIASNAQKQVAMHDLHGVKLAVIHSATIWGEDEGSNAGLRLRARNRKQDGLGVALPGGPVAVFEPHDGDMLLIGEGGLGNYAIGEDVEISLGESPQVFLQVKAIADGKDWTGYEAIVSNANPWPVTFEANLSLQDGQILEKASRRLGRKFGRPLWTVRVPANGEATLRYRLRETR